MILYASPTEWNDDPDIPVAGWRWVLDVSWGYLSWERQYLSADGTWLTWRTCGASGWSVSVTSRFALGSYHSWYDGPHCVYSLGFLRVVRHSWECAKCDPAPARDS